MNRGIFIVALILALRGAAWATDPDVNKPVSVDTDHLQTGDETEQKEGSASAVAASTGVITPVSPFTETDLHKQALDQLILANSLMAEKKYEAASDAALQAYDDLKDLRLRHRKGHDRSKLLSERHQAATTYIQAAIAYIQEFAERSTSAPGGLDEARARMEDLRDVARDYPELNRQLDQAIAKLGTPKSS